MISMMILTKAMKIEATEKEIDRMMSELRRPEVYDRLDEIDRHMLDGLMAKPRSSWCPNCLKLLRKISARSRGG